MCTAYEIPVVSTQPCALMRLRTLSETHSDWEKNGVGKVFDYYGRVPEAEYQPQMDLRHLERAVLHNDDALFEKAVADGDKVSHELNIGEMSCIEYSSMMGYDKMLKVLLQHSVNIETLRHYFSLDFTSRAFMMSKNKTTFFDKGALAEANRLEAALYTAIVYNQPRCLEVLVDLMGVWEPNKHTFIVNNPPVKQSMGASKLAEVLGHTECYNVLVQVMSPR